MSKEKHPVIKELLNVYETSLHPVIKADREEMVACMRDLGLFTPEEQRECFKTILEKLCQDKPLSKHEQRVMTFRNRKKRFLRPDIELDFHAALMDFIYNAFEIDLENQEGTMVEAIDDITNRLSEYAKPKEPQEESKAVESEKT